MENNPVRYSDAELLEFKEFIDQKIETAKEQIQSLSNRAENISESNGNDGDWIDSSSNMQDLNMLYAMIGRQRKHVQDLENALFRIRNKSFGICTVSGQLIDKRRLMAVPTTSKSLVAKMDIPEKRKREAVERRKTTSTKTPTSFSRVIKRTGGNPMSKPVVAKDNFLDQEEDDFDFEEMNNIMDGSLENDE